MLLAPKGLRKLPDSVSNLLSFCLANLTMTFFNKQIIASNKNLDTQTGAQNNDFGQCWCQLADGLNQRFGFVSGAGLYWIWWETNNLKFYIRIFADVIIYIFCPWVYELTHTKCLSVPNLNELVNFSNLCNFKLFARNNKGNSSLQQLQNCCVAQTLIIHTFFVKFRLIQRLFFWNYLPQVTKIVMLCRYSEFSLKKGDATKMNKQRLSYSGPLHPLSVCQLSWFLGTEETKTTWRNPFKWCQRRDLSPGHICLIFECSLPCATLANVGTCALKLPFFLRFSRVKLTTKKRRF